MWCRLASCVVALVALACVAGSSWALQWTIETVESEGNVGTYTSLALDGSARPHVSYWDGTNRDLKYATWTGSTWAIETVDSTGYVGQWTSLALDASGNPRISYYDETNSALKYAAWTGSTWAIETVDSTDSVGTFTSLALDSSGTPHISYFDYTNSALKYAVWTGSTWAIETVDSTGYVGQWTSLALDASGNPRISYTDATNADLKYAAWNSSTETWDIEIVDNGTAAGWYSSLVLDDDGYAHIAYRAYYDVKYAVWDGSEWDLQTVYDVGDLEATTLALDANGVPHIAFYEDINDDLMYATYEDSSWQVETVDSDGNVGLHGSITVDDGVVHISYWDSSNADFKHAVGAPPPAVCYVDDSNTAGPWQGTAEYPYQTIQAGIDVVMDGGEVIVLDGTYTGSDNRDLDFGGKSLVLVSENGPEDCVIDCEGVTRAFIFVSGETSSAVVDGFTITDGGVTGNGGAILCTESDPTIKNCIIYGNYASDDGGALCLDDSQSAIVSCVITGNEADGDGGGLAVTNGSNASIINCTIVGNIATDGGVSVSGSNPTLTNCIVWGNSPDAIEVVSGTPTVNYSDIDGGWTGAGGNNINQDPAFFGDGEWDGGTWTQGTYPLRDDSPCIDGGYGDGGTTVPDTDILGASRTDDLNVTDTGGGTPTYVDMGAQERDSSWWIAGVGDFGNNGKADVLWFEPYAGTVEIWMMNGTTVSSIDEAPSLDPSLGWQLKGCADFNADGKADILWRNSSTGAVAVWLMNGANMVWTGVLDTVDPASGWAIKDTGDFNADGRNDILWRESTTGQVAVWLVGATGKYVASTGVVSTVDPASGWAIKGTGDFNGDGKDEILWRNLSSGDVAIWRLNGTAFAGSGVVQTGVDLAWGISGTGDTNADGKTDIVWLNSSTYQVAVWLMNGYATSGTGVVSTLNPGAGWQIEGVDDLDNDGKADIVFHNSATGQAAVWLLNGVTFRTGQVIGTRFP